MLWFDPQPNEAEAAAALAAIELCLAAQAAVQNESPAALAPRSRWHESSRLPPLGLRPQRLSVSPSWATIERLRRASRG